MSWFELLGYWLVSSLALALTAALMPGFRIRGFGTAMIASLALSVANYFVRPILVFLTLPLTIITLGLFLFVVDAIILRICAALLPRFEISGWLSAFFGAILLAITSTFLHWLFI